MYLLGLGLVLMAMKYFEIGFVAAWAWWLVLTPFGLAMLWWYWADSSGYTKRRTMDRENARRNARIDKNREAMGTLSRKKKD